MPVRAASLVKIEGISLPVQSWRRTQSHRLHVSMSEENNSRTGRRGMMQLMLGTIAVGVSVGPSSSVFGESAAKKDSFAAEAKSGGTAGVAVSVAKQTIR